MQDGCQVKRRSHSICHPATCASGRRKAAQRSRPEFGMAQMGARGRVKPRCSITPLAPKHHRGYCLVSCVRGLACSIPCRSDWKEDTRQLGSRQALQIHSGTTDPVDQAELLGLSAGLKSLARSPRGRMGPGEVQPPGVFKRGKEKERKKTLCM